MGDLSLQNRGEPFRRNQFMALGYNSPGKLKQDLHPRPWPCSAWRQAALSNSQPPYYQLHRREKPFRPSWSPQFLICKSKVNMPPSKTDI